MSVMISIFYFIVIITIVANILRVVKTFRANNNMFDNIESMVRQRYNDVMQNSANVKNQVIEDSYDSVDLDKFMKSNSNPIKETKGKRRKI